MLFSPLVSCKGSVPPATLATNPINLAPKQAAGMLPPCVLVLTVAQAKKLKPLQHKKMVLNIDGPFATRTEFTYKKHPVPLTRATPYQFPW